MVISLYWRLTETVVDFTTTRVGLGRLMAYYIPILVAGSVEGFGLAIFENNVRLFVLQNC